MVRHRFATSVATLFICAVVVTACSEEDARSRNTFSVDASRAFEDAANGADDASSRADAADSATSDSQTAMLDAQVIMPDAQVMVPDAQVVVPDGRVCACSAGETGTETVMHPCGEYDRCLLYTSPSPRDRTRSRMPSSA